jgi:autotransporter-associated beta strand protein
MKPNRNNPLLPAALMLALAAPTLNAADLTWDTDASDGSAITAGSGAWNTTGTNLVWNNGTTNEIWSQTSATQASNAAVFAGSDGTLNQYVITLSGTVNAQSVTFNNSGYQLSGAALILRPTSTTNGSITVAADKTATISSTITYSNNAQANITVNSGSTLNLGGGASNSQYRFAGAGTVNMTAGTYTANVGFINAATFNQTGGTFNMNLPAGTDRYSIGVNAGRSVSYTLSGGTINANASNDTNANSLLAIGRAHSNTAFTNTLNVQGTGVLNVGTTTNRAGELHIASSADSNGTLNVTGGTVTVGTGKTDNKIYFFKAGSNPGYSANLTQSGGTITANGIQFGSTTGSYDATSAANLTLSGGSLYIGTQGITRGSAAAALPVTIQIQGGTLGASQDWSSSMDMQLGTAATIRAQDSGGNARNITLSGILSNDGAANGTLTKTGLGTLILSGANSYTGGTTVNAGTLLWSGANDLPATGTLQVNAGGNFSLADGTAHGTSTAALGLASGAMLSFDWNAGSVDTLTSTAAATTEGTVGLVINNTSPSGSGGTLISSALGGLTTTNGTRYLLANNTDYTAALTVTDTAVSIGAQSPATALTDAYWVGGQVTGAAGAMNLSDGTTSNWATDAAGTSAAGVVPGGSAVNVIFGAAGATQQGNVTMVTDLNLGSITFNDGAAVTLGGSYFLTLNSTSATAATSAGAGMTVTPGSAITVTSSANATNTINSNIVLGVGQTWNVAGDKTLTVGGTVSGTSALTKADAGTLTLTGTNTYTGATTISGGTLQLGGSGVLNNGNYAGAISLGSGATFENAGSATQTLSGAITGTGGSVKLSGIGQFILSNSSNGYGALDIGDGRVFISSNAGALPAAATVEITGGILVLGTGTSYGNSITVQDGGGIASRASAGTSLTGTVALPGSGTVSFNNDDARTYGLSITSGQTLTGNLTVQIGGNRTNNNLVGAVTLSGKLTGGGSLTVASSGQTASPHFGTGVLNLTSAANDYTGGTTLNQGTLSLGTIGTLGASTGALAVNNDNNTAAGTQAVLNLATGVDTTVGSLSGMIATPTSGTNTATINTQTGRTFTVNQTANGTYAGVIAGGGNFALGSGSSHALTLTGNNTYTGSTTVSSGSLIINGAIASTSVVVNGSLGGSAVMANATLGGSGSINPGNSPGILTAAATNPAGGLDYNFEFTAANALPDWDAPDASVNDVLRLTDASAPFTDALGAGNVVTVYLNVGSLTLGDVFTGGFYTDNTAAFLSSISGGTFLYYLADAGGSTSYGGNLYNAYTGPLTFDLATVSQTADFGAGSVNGFTTRFTVVPEPNVTALLGGLGILALFRRRR